MSQLIKNEEKKPFRFSGDMFDILVMTVFGSVYMFLFSKGSTYPITTVVAAFVGSYIGHTAVTMIFKKYRKK